MESQSLLLVIPIDFPASCKEKGTEECCNIGGKLVYKASCPLCAKYLFEYIHSRTFVAHTILSLALHKPSTPRNKSA
jgi:hypothetical protein